MTLQSMTYHESYGELPRRLLNLYKNNNVSPADHDRILMAFDCSWNDTDIPWNSVIVYVQDHCHNGQLYLSTYM
jgi:ribosome biogenesis protein Tsr3